MVEILFKTILLFLFLDSAIFQSGTCYPEVRSIWRINLSSNCFSFFLVVSAIFQSGTCYTDARSVWHINLISICCTFFLFLVSAIFQSSTCYTEARFVELLNLVYDLFYIVFRQIPERQQIVIDPKGPFFSSFRHFPIRQLLPRCQIYLTHKSQF